MNLQDVSITNWLLTAVAGGLLAISFAIIYAASKKK